jgi:hypothetical protein
VRPTQASNLAEMSFTHDWLDNEKATKFDDNPTRVKPIPIPMTVAKQP